MAGDDDLDWLYRRERPKTAAERAGVERTRAFSPDEAEALARQPRSGGSRTGQSSAGQPSAGRSGDGGARSGSSADASRPVQPVPAPRPPADPGGGGRGGSGGSGPERQRRRRRRRPGRTLGVLVLLVVVAFLAYLVAVPLVAWSNVESVDDQPAGGRPADQPGRTYLLVGSDSREGLSKKDKKKLGTGDAEGQRTDTMMILYVPPDGEPALVSLPRDSYVSIPGHGMNKINAAYAFGGAKLLTETVEQATGLRMDHYVEIGFGGFVSIIDALDGIEMCLPDAIEDKNSHLDLEAGCQTLDGANALGYVRMRYADPEGDLGRVKRQRQMIGAVATKAASAESVLNPVRYWKLNHAVAGALTLGETTGLGDMPAMAKAMLALNSDDGLNLTVPIAGNISTPAGAALSWDEEGAKELFSTIADGSTEGLEKFAKDE